jgi:hypothetical protein
MDTNAKRQVTEAEVLSVEEAFSEFEDQGSTQKKCPWCAGELKFNAVVSGYSIRCAECEFKVTVRGI